MPPIRLHFLLGFLALILATPDLAVAADDPSASEVWYPRKDSPRLITPQWVGEAGVECVVTLAIDDMRDPAKYEAYLRPILQRLKQIDGRAPVSIMTCQVKPDDPQLQEWLKEGLSLECHTADHPCPILAEGNIKKSKATFDKCVDLMSTIPNSKPVAFRTPCCDSLNTVSPRLFSEIINRTTPAGNFLQLDSSVFTLYTPDDPAIPRDLLADADGREKFRKYIPRKLTRGNLVHDGFVNIIENYPYPYVIQRLCWEFPCMVPSDWSANHLQKPNNPNTVRDLKIALDITVQKQGVFNLVFHPHGWIKAEQVIELIDHAVAKHGKKVKFLTFRECVDKLNTNVLRGQQLRNDKGNDASLRLVDLNGDSYFDVLSDAEQGSSRTWNPAASRWNDVAPRVAAPTKTEPATPRDTCLVDLNDDGRLDKVVSNATEYGAWLTDDKGKLSELLHVKRGDKPDAEIVLPPIIRADGSENGFFVRDRQLCWINEDTDGLVDFVMRVAFDKLIGDRLSEAKSPDGAKQSMRVAPGFRVDLVAHEPLTMDPVALDWGPDGKMWVAEMADYPRGMDDKGKPGGRIRFLEDTNGDGIYDKSTLFLEEVPFPNGVISWKKGVLVSAAPDVFYAEDTDGDGKADLKKILFTGFSEGNQQHRANGFSRGLDNWLYMANGDSGGAIRVVGILGTGKVSDDINQKVDIRSRDIRLRPDTCEIETVIGQSQFGRNRDDWGNWFGNNNSRPMWHYLLDDHYLRRNQHLIAPALQKDVSVAPGAAPVYPASRTLTRFNDFHTANRFTSACSTMVYRDNLLFGSEPVTDSATSPFTPLVSHVFISEPVHNLVHREVMRPEGLSFTSERAPSEQQSEFLASTDNWFRPTQIKTGPDGALYVADMYRLVIEHPQWIPIEWQRKLDLRAGQDKGRIWRVAPLNAKLRAVPRLDKMTTPQLVDALRHSNSWQRDMAQQLLLDRADPESIPLLATQATLAQAASSDQSEFNTEALGRLHSLSCLDGLAAIPAVSGQAMKTLSGILPTVLADAHPGVRRHAIRCTERLSAVSDAVWQGLAKRIDDPDAQARMQLAYTLGELKHPQAGALLGQLAVQGESIRTGGAIVVSPQFMAAILSSLRTDNLEAVLSTAMKQGSGQTELLQQLLAQATAFNHEPSLVALLNRATEPSSDWTYERWQYAAVEQFLVSLDRRFTTLDKWLKGLKPESQPIAARLKKLFAKARELAASDVDVDTRIAAVRVLGRSPDSQADAALLSDLITPRHPPELQSAALATLAKSKSSDVAHTLLANYRSFAPALRTQSCDILLSRDAWRDELLTALEKGLLSAADLDAGTRQRLLDHKSKSVAERAAKLLAVNLNSDRARLVAEYLPTIRAGGDVQLGSQLFQKMCSQCHKLGNVGHAVGPDLISLTDKSPDAMITAVLDPNRAVETKFLTFIAVTKSGVSHTGLLASETAGSITLRAAEGKEITLLRSEIDELQSNLKSLMPEGLERDLKPDAAAALISFIRLNVPLPAMKKFPGNEPRVVAADATGGFQLTPKQAEIYGPTIVVEDKYQNLGWWSSADDIVVWTIDVPKAGVYSIQWTYACDPSAAGNRIVIEAAGKSLTHRVDKTASWDDYQNQQIGSIELPAGQVRITVKPAARPLPALADVKFIVLKPGT